MPNITKSCPSCQQLFTFAESKQKKFCSQACWLSSTAKRKKRTCEGCGGLFSGQNQKFCSRECMAQGWNTLRQRVCQFCTATFTVTSPSVPGIYCSSSCSANAYSKAHRTIFNCKNCGIESSVIQYRIGKNGAGQFCSNKCRLISAKSGRWDANCEQCGKSFVVLGYRYKAKYCSKECQNAVRSAIRIYRMANDWQCEDCKSQYSAGHPSCRRCGSRKNRQRSKLRVIAHYGGTCACCGEARIEFLCIDHQNNDGNAHRKSYFQATGLKLGGARFYNWLWRNNYPSGYRVLCFNCNCSRGMFGYCPHEKEKDVPTVSQSASGI